MLFIVNCWNVGDELLVALGSQCKELQHLLLSEAMDVTDTGISALAACIKLRLLELEYCDEYTGIGLVAVARNCSAPLEIELAHNEHITDAIVQSIILAAEANNSSALHTLKCSHCRCVSPEMQQRLIAWCAARRSE